MLLKESGATLLSIQKKDINIERIEFDPTYWNKLIQKLEDFYDNCLASDIVSPVHVLGLKVHDLRLM